MKVKTIKVPVTWMETGSYEFTYPADMPDEEAMRKAYLLASLKERPEGEYLTDSFMVDEEGVLINEKEEEDDCPDICRTIIKSISFKVELNRDLDDDEMISPGSYNITSTDTFNLDFMDFEGYRRGNGIIEVIHKNLDTKSFPKSVYITPSIIENGIFTDFYIDLEGCREDVRVLRVFDVEIEYDNGESIRVNDNKVKHVLDELNYYQCVHLIDLCIKNSFIQKDPNEDNNILVYRKKSSERPEGWYSANVMTSAQELYHDVEGQRYLLGRLEEAGVKPELKEPWWLN